MQPGDRVSKADVRTDRRTGQHSILVGEAVNEAEARLGLAHACVTAPGGPRPRLAVAAHAREDKVGVMRVDVFWPKAPLLEGCARMSVERNGEQRRTHLTSGFEVLDKNVALYSELFH